jgi:hydrogenase-4 component B
MSDWSLALGTYPDNIPLLGFWLMLALYLAGALLAYALPGLRLGYRVAAALAALAGIAGVVCGVGVLAGAPAPQAEIPSALPFGPLVIHLDPLGAFFLVVIGLVSTPVALYSIGYFLGKPRGITGEGGTAAGGEAKSGQRDLRPYAVLLALTLLSLVLVVSAADAILFLMAWEGMAFLSYFAALYHYQDRKVTRSLYVMLAVSEGGTALIIAAFLFLYQASHTFTFAGMRLAGPEMGLPLRSALFFLVLLGFGAKAGLLPFQVSLTEAYPAAPGPMSAVLSALISKMAFYGFFRFLLDLLGGGPTWWGLVLLLVGITTALGGVLYSLVQHNLKRLLAYSSVEHMGILLTGLGAALTFQSLRLPVLAAIAAMATLYHVLNHATFKGLLFLGAGAVERATGTVDLERLGGLARRLPVAGACFLVGALAISAVPPFNGYISEWMLLESLLQSFNASDTLAKIVMTITGATLALVAGIGVTAFVRAFGVPFLSLPRSPEAEQARSTPGIMRLGLVWLAALCLILGIIPPLVLAGLDRVLTPLLGVSVINQVVPPLYTNHPGDYAPLVGLGGGLFQGLVPGNGLVVIAAPNFSTIDSPSYLFLAELGLLLVLWLARRAIRPLGTRRIGPVWAGGIPRFHARMSYSGVAFSNPLRLMFNTFYRSQSTTELTAPAARHQRGTIKYQQEIPPPFERNLYQPLWRVVQMLARRVKVVQSGNINLYLAYIFGIVLLILLLRAL